MKLAIVGSGPLHTSKLVTDVIYKYLRQYQPEVFLLPGHTRFNRLVRAQAQRLSLAVGEIRPLSPAASGKPLQCPPRSLGKAPVDMVLAFRVAGRPRPYIAQWAAEESVVLTVRPSAEL